MFAGVSLRCVAAKPVSGSGQAEAKQQQPFTEKHVNEDPLKDFLVNKARDMIRNYFMSMISSYFPPDEYESPTVYSSEANLDLKKKLENVDTPIKQFSKQTVEIVSSSVKEQEKPEPVPDQIKEIKKEKEKVEEKSKEIGEIDIDVKRATKARQFIKSLFEDIVKPYGFVLPNSPTEDFSFASFLYYFLCFTFSFGWRVGIFIELELRRRRDFYYDYSYFMQFLMAIVVIFTNNNLKVTRFLLYIGIAKFGVPFVKWLAGFNLPKCRSTDCRDCDKFFGLAHARMTTFFPFLFIGVYFGLMTWFYGLSFYFVSYFFTSVIPFVDTSRYTNYVSDYVKKKYGEIQAFGNILCGVPGADEFDFSDSTYRTTMDLKKFVDERTFHLGKMYYDFELGHPQMFAPSHRDVNVKLTDFPVTVYDEYGVRTKSIEKANLVLPFKEITSFMITDITVQIKTKSKIVCFSTIEFNTNVGMRGGYCKKIKHQYVLTEMESFRTFKPETLEFDIFQNNKISEVLFNHTSFEKIKEDYLEPIVSVFNKKGRCVPSNFEVKLETVNGGSEYKIVSDGYESLNANSLKEIDGVDPKSFIGKYVHCLKAEFSIKGDVGIGSDTLNLSRDFVEISSLNKFFPEVSIDFTALYANILSSSFCEIIIEKLRNSTQLLEIFEKRSKDIKEVAFTIRNEETIKQYNQSYAKESLFMHRHPMLGKKVKKERGFFINLLDSFISYSMPDYDEDPP